MTSLFVELCAGLASVSGCLQHGSGWKPPVSRMGRKTGYAKAILRVMGLRPGGKAGAFLWAEADGDVAALLAAYTQPEKMREIAAIIRSWIPCPYGPHGVDPSCSRCKGTGRWDARDLWEVLRREERRGLWAGGGSAGEVARRAWHLGVDHQGRGGSFTGEFRALSPQAAEHLGPTTVEKYRALYGCDSAGRVFGKQGCSRPEVAAACDRAALPWPPVLIAQDAAVDVGNVAGWAWLALRAPVGVHPGEGFKPTEHGPGNHENADIQPARFASCPVWPPTHLTPSADLPVPPLPPGTVVYMDPPYADTTGYKHTFPRAAVIETALRWHHAGAGVYISEGEPIPIPGWFHVEIGGERVGQARTFTRSASEWLTCSVPPAWTPPRQSALFGGGR